MNITVGELIDNEPRKFEYILNGNVGINNKISYITIMDTLDIVDWIKGEELLISGTFLERSFNEKFIYNLASKKCAGIITKYKFAKKLNKYLVDLCTSLNLPIIIVPDYYSWSEIMNPVNFNMIKKYYTNIESMNRFHNLLIKAAVENNSLEELCDAIISAVNINFAIISNSYIPISMSKDFHWQNYFYKINFNHLKNTIISYNLEGEAVWGKVFTTDEFQNLKYFLMQFSNKDNLGYFLIEKEGNTDIIPTNEIINLQFSGLIYSLRANLKKEIDNSIKSTNSLILNDILATKSITDELISSYSYALNKNLHKRYTILTIKIDIPSVKKEQIFNIYLNHVHYKLIKKNPPLNEILIFELKKNIVLLIPNIPSINLKAYVKKQLETLINYIKKSSGSIYLGIGNSHSFKNLKIAYQESIQALNFSIQNNITNRINSYNSLGLIRFFCDNQGYLNNTFYNELIHKYIKPIINYDKLNNTDLYTTLKTYFFNDQSNKKTYNMLFIHKNTLRARLKTIEKIIDSKLSGDELFNIQLSLRVYELIEETKN